MIDFKSKKRNFNDPSDSLGNRNKALTFRCWSLTYMQDASEEVAFKAFITSFNDEFTSNWTEDAVYGRMDPLSVFQNTQRIISVELDVPASSKQEAKENLIKIEKIIQGLYPVYEQYNGVPVLQAAPLWKIKLANFITSTSSANDTAKSGGLTCKLDGFNFSPDFEPGVFVEKSGYYFPKNIKVSFNALVFHDHTVGHNQNRDFLSNFGGFPYGVDFEKGGLDSSDMEMVDEFITNWNKTNVEIGNEELNFKNRQDALQYLKNMDGQEDTGDLSGDYIAKKLRAQKIKEATKSK